MLGSYENILHVKTIFSHLLYSHAVMAPIDSSRQFLSSRLRMRMRKRKLRVSDTKLSRFCQITLLDPVLTDLIWSQLCRVLSCSQSFASPYKAQEAAPESLLTQAGAGGHCEA